MFVSRILDTDFIEGKKTRCEGYGDEFPRRRARGFFRVDDINLPVKWNVAEDTRRVGNTEVWVVRSTWSGLMKLLVQLPELIFPAGTTGHVEPQI